jgi:hypothetical protein
MVESYPIPPPILLTHIIPVNQSSSGIKRKITEGLFRCPYTQDLYRLAQEYSHGTIQYTCLSGANAIEHVGYLVDQRSKATTEPDLSNA